MAYDRLEPIGYRRLDLLIAHLAYSFFQSTRTIGHKMDKLPTIEDFLPSWSAEEQDPEVQAEEARERLRAKALAAFGFTEGAQKSGS